MDHFVHKSGEAYCEDVPLRRIAAEQGTPVYVYSRATLARHCRRIREAFAAYPTLPCFAVKANSNLSILRTVFGEGFGADLVSIGELERALLAGVDPRQVVFSGVGKRAEEIRRALEVGLLSFNVESRYELELIGSIAEAAGLEVPVSLRINPDINARTHPKIATGLYTTKFGLAEEDASELLGEIRHQRRLRLVGLGCHIGSQITDLEPLRAAAERMAELALSYGEAGHDLEFVNMGGGLGIRYRDEIPPTLEAYAEALIDPVRSTGLRLIIEPGRVVAGNMGVLVTRVVGVKETPAKQFIVIDAAMNDLMRPSIYDAYHEIVPVRGNGGSGSAIELQTVPADFVGPICETGDVLGKNRQVVYPRSDDLFFIRGCGAYAASMASQYNSRARAPEVLVDGDDYRVVRRRETLSSLWELELEGLDD